MNFVQVEYPAFLALLLAVYWALPHRRWQNLLLVVASAVFYGWVHPWFLILLYGSSILDFSLAQAIERFPRRRWTFVGLSAFANLSLLAYFKYAGFFVDNVRAVLESAGVPGDLGTLDILLPVGISFYTFQTLGYTVDVARGELKARTSFLDYVLYVSFFAQLVAGPIERSTRLLPQIERDRRWSWTMARSGVGLALWGGFKKLVVADSIAPFVDKVYVLDDPAGPLLWAATAGFMLQIYADFSGYTDLARGSARLLGFELQENFNAPFLATTTSEFWQRWHMSLSFWIRDYVLGPLVGDSPGGVSRFRFFWATVLTFVLIGFWHGASWNFVLFGLYHGLWVIVYGLVARRIPVSVRAMPGGRVLAAAFHLLAVGLVGSMLFREQHLDRIVEHLTRNPLSAGPAEWVATVVLLSMTAALAAPLVFAWAWGEWVRPRVQTSPWYLPIETTTWAMWCVAMYVFYRVTAQDFVYFQF
ncbi:MAG: alginate O-acetyltransferase complex protein AlgI [Myxococcota bacterium]|jgi:alginate O-acetyltransferase complex protein AlgI